MHARNGPTAGDYENYDCIKVLGFSAAKIPRITGSGSNADGRGIRRTRVNERLGKLLSLCLLLLLLSLLLYSAGAKREKNNTK